MSGPESEAVIDQLQRRTFRYFLHEADVTTGLVPDSTVPGAPASLAVIGLHLTALPVGVERGIVTREEALATALATLRFFRNAPHGPEPDATGYRGFYYHFLDMQTGRRAWDSELSTMDTALFLAGALTAARYFDGEEREAHELRRLAHELYGRAEWSFMLAEDGALSHGWRPETGFLPYHWRGYSEALLMYLLALGSPSDPIPETSYRAFTSTYAFRRVEGIRQLYAGPLFIHQFPQIWLDARGIQDEPMRGEALDYFENSRRATLAQQRYAERNPRGFAGYGGFCWGITASEGPGPGTHVIRGKKRRFADYLARGIPYGPDDGTLAPWGAIASLPFAPEVVLPTIAHLLKNHANVWSGYGFLASFNPTFPDRRKSGWIAQKYFGLNIGPIVLMIENYRTGLIWKLMRPQLRIGLERAGFRGGWLGS